MISKKRFQLVVCCSLQSKKCVLEEVNSDKRDICLGDNDESTLSERMNEMNSEKTE